ncbi:MAG: aminopeptidase P family protein [Solirubrobacterales bacterium]|nr:aminopeptidase P family protein [Solirubrobacterales bacterium]
MPDLLIYADTERSAALRHEVPIAIGDPFLYAERDGRVAVQASSLERERLAEARPDAELHDIADLGFHELLESGMARSELELELAMRLVERLGVTDALVPAEFPLGLADKLRARGVSLTPDHDLFAARRRSKAPAEMEGIRRAQRAAEAGMAAAAALFRAADVGDGERGPTLHVGGAPLTAEQVRAAMRAATRELGAETPPDVIVASVWQGFGHEAGSGPLPANLPIQVDLWPRDEASSCWADMTRTFLVGEVPEEARRQEELVHEVLRRTSAAARPGVTGRELHAITCEVFEGAGYRTQRTGPGDDPSEGFQFSLGHGVGLEVHEDPSLGQAGRAPLVAGDVLAVEPGLWDRHVGGVRFEDLWLVTEDGIENLTDFPYDLAP